MRHHLLLAVIAAAATARAIASNDQEVLGSVIEAEKYLIELAPGETRWIEEDEKWALRRVCRTTLGASSWRDFTPVYLNDDR